MKDIHYAELVENIAEEMWFLIRSSRDQDWSWCHANLPKTAADLRERSESVVKRSFKLFLADQQRESSDSGKMDLRVKEALIRIS